MIDLESMLVPACPHQGGLGAGPPRKILKNRPTELDSRVTFTYLWEL